MNNIDSQKLEQVFKDLEISDIPNDILEFIKYASYEKLALSIIHRTEKLNTEEWKDIPGYENLYQISSTGKVKSLRFRGGNAHNYLKGSETQDGYRKVDLYKNGTRKTLNIHSIVAECFLPEKPKEKEVVVDHIDGDKKNNNANNLQYITSRENAAKGKRSMQTIMGVYYYKDKDKWTSLININGKSLNLGFFDSEFEAYKAYLSELHKYKKEGIIKF
jgi:hypothetical protein